MNTSDRSLGILIVDDEEIVASLASDALEGEYDNIQVATTPAQALTLIHEHDIRLIITDIRMPGMNGNELVKQARQVRPDLGAIYMTGYADLNSAKEAIKQGAYDYILKPFELRELRTAVANAVARIGEAAANKMSDQHLNSLTDLNQAMYAVGDRSSLLLASLRFSLLHCASTVGCVAVPARNGDATTVISLTNNESSEHSFPLPDTGTSFASLVNTHGAVPAVYDSLDTHPFAHNLSDSGLLSSLKELFQSLPGRIASLPITRSDSVSGVMLIHMPPETHTLIDANLKFLTITMSQLALSLENLALLEKTQAAYSRLKELQDVTIDLEKMATRGEMAAEIAHELNNFLAVVSGKAQLLERMAETGNFAAAPKHIKAISDNVALIQHFTTNLMEYNPEGGKREIVPFARILDEVIDYLRPQKRYAGVTIRKRFEFNPQLSCDLTNLQQLLYNLFNNAADATHDCPVRELSATVMQGHDPAYFRFSLRDTGCGIEPEYLERAFNERFTTKKHGHGFGLVVCKRIIDNHQGQLSIDSTPGKGTTISIDFPRAATDQPASEQTALETAGVR